MLNERVRDELRWLEQKRQKLVRLGEKYPDLEIEQGQFCTIFCSPSVNPRVDQFAVSPIDGEFGDLRASFWIADDSGDDVHSAPHLFVVASYPRRGVVLEHPNWAEHMRGVKIPERMIAEVATRLAAMGATKIELSPKEATRQDWERDSACLMIATSSANLFHDAFYLDRTTIAYETYRAILRRANAMGVHICMSETGDVLPNAHALNARIDEYARELRIIGQGGDPFADD
jgi:hypothetical protein